MSFSGFVATVSRMARIGKQGKKLLGADPDKLLEKIQRVVIKQQAKFDIIYKEILKELLREKVFIIHEKQLNREQAVFVKKYFREQVQPFLAPIMIDSAPEFPYLRDKSIYLAVKLSRKAKGKKSKYSLIEIPTDIVSRFLVLPSVDEKKYIILLDDVIRFCFDEIFSIFQYEVIEGFTIKMTRDAELDIESDISKSWIEKIEKGLKLRKKGAPVRLTYDERISPDLLSFILKKTKLNKEEYLIPGARYHNFKDFINFPKVGRKELNYPEQPPIDHTELRNNKSLFKVIREKDILLSYPYHSFRPIVDLLREASIDPRVQSIKITLYRAAKNSSIVNALVNAIKNGKQVTAIVELQARFDEESNIHFANRLQEEGAQVIFGIPGLKVHSKVFLIARKEEGKTALYAHVGTGNFNEHTARIYTDHSLLTFNKKITREAEKLFMFYRDNYKTGNYKHLIVSPFNTRKKFIALINKEIENAKDQKEAWMLLKMNSLVDAEMISKLYEASNAGVKIKMIVRGVCSLVPGVKNQSSSIDVISIVDKFLEHSRIFIFCHGGNEKYFISSGDWMYRNLDFRSEVAVPVFDETIQAELKNYIRIQLLDNCKARILNKAQDNQFVQRTNGTLVRAQSDIYRMISGKWNPVKFLTSHPAFTSAEQPVNN